MVEVHTGLAAGASLTCEIESIWVWIWGPSCCPDMIQALFTGMAARQGNPEDCGHLLLALAFDGLEILQRRAGGGEGLAGALHLLGAPPQRHCLRLVLIPAAHATAGITGKVGSLVRDTASKLRRCSEST